MLFLGITGVQAEVLDENFGTNGLVTTNVNPNLNSETALSLLVMENQKIIVGGTDNTNGFIVRYDENGTLDTTFQNNGILQLPVSSVLDFIAISANEYYFLAQKKGSELLQLLKYLMIKAKLSFNFLINGNPEFRSWKVGEKFWRCCNMSIEDILKKKQSGNYFI